MNAQQHKPSGIKLRLGGNKNSPAPGSAPGTPAGRSSATPGVIVDNEALERQQRQVQAGLSGQRPPSSGGQVSLPCHAKSALPPPALNVNRGSRRNESFKNPLRPQSCRTASDNNIREPILRVARPQHPLHQTESRAKRNPASLLRWIQYDPPAPRQILDPQHLNQHRCLLRSVPPLVHPVPHHTPTATCRCSKATPTWVDHITLPTALTTSTVNPENVRPLRSSRLFFANLQTAVADALLPVVVINTHPQLNVPRPFKFHIPASPRLTQQSVTVSLPSSHSSIQIQPHVPVALTQRPWRIFVIVNNTRVNQVPASLEQQQSSSTAASRDKSRQVYETRLQPGVNRIDVEIVAASVPSPANPKAPEGIEMEKCTVFVNLMR